MSTLRSSLGELATAFADSVLAAVRGASLDELLAESGGARTVGNSRRGKGAGGPVGNGKSPGAAHNSPTRDGHPATGRLPRRSAEDIAAALDRVIALVKKNKDGLRAEEIRAALKMQAKEMPRILKEGLSTKKLKSKGQKRATAYWAS
jgi:hypothetical protein